MARVLIGEDARRALFAPLLRNVRAINASLGPHGRPVLYSATPTSVALAADGVTIAVEMADGEGPASIGPRILKETLWAAQRDLGDGTARLACMLGAILQEGAKYVAAGYEPQALADEILRLGEEIGGRLKELRVPAPDLYRIAATFTFDPRLAEVLATAVVHAGAEGVVDVDLEPRAMCEVETGQGYSVDLQLASEHLGPTPPATTLVLDDAFVLVANDAVNEFGRLGPILEGFASRRKSLAVVAREVGGSALDALVRNRRELGLYVVALKPVDIGPRAASVLEDLAIATGATFIDSESSVSLQTASPSHLGRAKQMRCANAKAVFVEPAGKREAIESRRAWLAAEAERVRYLSYDLEHVRRRSARLAGAWSRIRIGGHTGSEGAIRLAECKAAVASLQASLASGVIAGGGAAFLREGLRLRAEGQRESGESGAAHACLARGLEAVAANIASNAGHDPAFALAAVRYGASSKLGFDARSGRRVDLVFEGIVDPVSISGGTLARAVSAAATMLRVEALICT